MNTLKTISVIFSLITLNLNAQSSANQPQIEIEYEDQLKIISWETNSETNSSYFILERSNGEEDFEIVSIIKASGYSTSPKKYEFEDSENIDGKTTYQLSLIRMGGEVAFTSNKIVNTSINLNNSSSIVLK